MKRIGLHRFGRLIVLAGSGLILQFGSCATTNQLKDFMRTEIALVLSQILAEPFNDGFADFAGPQTQEETVPSI